MPKILVHTEVMGPEFSELVLHELDFQYSREEVTLAIAPAALPVGIVLMRNSDGEYTPLTEVEEGTEGNKTKTLGGDPLAVLIKAAPASTATQTGLVIRRAAIVNGAALKFDAGVTTKKDDAKLALCDLGIVVKE